MKVNTQTSLLQEIPYHCSPNQDQRPDQEDISLLVIHGISLPPNDFGSGHIHNLFMNQLDPNYHPYFKDIHTLRVSCHLFIDREGNIAQYVPFNKRAWHAGQSAYNGRENCNDFSIGIELEGSDHIPYTSAQYFALAECTKSIMDTFNIVLPHVQGHSDIAPERKSDPGESFDWERYHLLIEKLTN